MWKEIFETKVIRVEGFDDPSLISCVYISEILSDELDPYNKDESFELPMRSSCRIVLKSRVSNISKSICFNTNIIEDDGVQWLPLYESQSEDKISRIPEEVVCPRVLILLQKKISLDVIKEGGEKSEIGSACDEDYMPEIKLCHSFAGGNPFDETFEQTSQEITEVNNARHFGFNIADEINQELRANLERTSKLLELEKKSKENVLKDMENMKNRFLQELSEAKNREKEILDVVKESENKQASYKFEITKLKNEIKGLSAENLRLSQTIKNNEEFNLRRIEELSKKIQIFEESNDSEKIISKISEMTGVNFENSNEKLKEQEEIIKKLRKENSELKEINSSFKNVKNENIDELEEAVQRHMKNFNFSYQLTRDREQVYVYGSKKISILLRDGQLLCRVGGIFKPFEEYIHAFFNEGVQPTHKSTKSSSDVQKELEEANKMKSAQPRKVNKSVTLVQKPVKRGSFY